MKNGVAHELEGFDSVVLALGSRSFNPLEKELKDIVRTVVVGDAAHAGKIAQALHSAMEASCCLVTG